VTSNILYDVMMNHYVKKWRNDYMFLSEMYESAEENGYNKGLSEGEDKKMNQMIDNMLRADFSVEQIEVASGQSRDYIERRRKALKDSTLVGA